MDVRNLIPESLIGKVGAKLVGSVVGKLMPSKSKDFASVMDGSQKSKSLSLEDFELSAQERQELEEMRQFAALKGVESLQVEIDGRTYNMTTQDGSLVPSYHTASNV